MNTHKLQFRRRLAAAVAVVWVTGALLSAVWVDTASGDYARPPYFTGPISQDYDEAAEMEGRVGNLVRGTDLIGTKVRNAQGDKLGKVKDLVFDDNEDAIYYVVLESGGNYYPIPWSAFKTERDMFMLNLSERAFERAPFIEELDLDDLRSAECRGRVREFYSRYIPQARYIESEEPAERTADIRRAAQAPRLYLYRDVVGLDVQNPKGKSLADLEDIVIDVRKGNFAYGLVSYGGFWGIGEKTAAVPWQSLIVQPHEGVAKSDNISEHTLRAFVIDKNDMKTLIEPKFARDIHQMYGTEPYWDVFGYVPPEAGIWTVDAWKPKSTYNLSFDPDNMTVLEGTIVSIGTFHPETGAAPGTRLRVKNDAGEIVTIYAGPRAFWEAEGIMLESDDHIVVTGSKTKVNGKSVIMASEVSVRNETVKLRDLDGDPEWDTGDLWEELE